MTTDRVTAVVLAGGRSVRFGRDKLAEPVDGRSLLEHAIEGVRTVAGEVIVVAAPGAHPIVPTGVVVVRDTVAYEGPLAGLLVGLRTAHGPIVVVAGGDMPGLVPAVIASMVAALDAPEVQAVLLESDGRTPPLPMVVRRTAATAVAAQLVGAGVRRLGALTDDLATWIVGEADWRALDPDAATLRDIDSPADLG